MTSAEAAKRLGPLIRNQTTTMGLDNFPKRCDCAEHRGTSKPHKDGTTHGPGKPCPFRNDNFVTGLFGSCCLLRGQVAKNELEELGEDDLADRMFCDMTAEEAEDFAEDLRDAADRLERERAQGKVPKPKGIRTKGMKLPENVVVTYEESSTFEEKIAAIREAARWYQKVASMGYGVSVWY